MCNMPRHVEKKLKKWQILGQKNVLPSFFIFYSSHPNEFKNEIKTKIPFFSPGHCLVQYALLSMNLWKLTFQSWEFYNILVCHWRVSTCLQHFQLKFRIKKICVLYIDWQYIEAPWQQSQEKHRGMCLPWAPDIINHRHTNWHGNWIPWKPCEEQMGTALSLCIINAGMNGIQSMINLKLAPAMCITH